MRHLEDNLQIQIADYLRYCHPKLLWWHTPNGGKRNIREAARLKRMGVLPGVPDIIMFWEDGMGAIELKAGKGKQTEHQKDWEARWVALGGKYAIIRSISECEAILKQWEIL